MKTTANSSLTSEATRRIDMYALLGRHLSHSLSPQIHSLLCDYEYKLCPTEPDGLDAFFADENLKGFNVTIPYKTEAFKRCSELSDAAKKAGSVNTVVRRGNGTLYGDNTDYYGFLYMAQKIGCSFTGKKVVILGSGGASRTVQLVAKDEGAKEIVVISRNSADNYTNIHKHYDADIIVNATPVGMYPNNGQRLIDLSKFTECKKVLDLIYNPARTVLLLDAERLGIDCVNGLPMLVAQAVRAAEIFTGKSIPDSEIERIHGIILENQKNIVLIGMPGCGKSTSGTLLAEKLVREFADTDSVVEECGEAIPEIFEKYGEDEFRNRETNAIKAIAKEHGRIIATGGGAILREENRIALRENSTVIFLNAPVENLATSGRPLSAGGTQKLLQMYSERLPFYLETADFTVEVNPDPEVTVRRIIECASL